MRFAIELPDDDSITPVWNDPAALEDLDGLLKRADDAAHEISLRDADLIADIAVSDCMVIKKVLHLTCLFFPFFLRTEACKDLFY